MKVGVILFHKNIKKIYKERWIKESANSIINQSFKDFVIYEINYGGDKFSLSSISDFSNFEHKFFRIKKQNHAEAQNFLLQECFNDGCDYIFNTNLDDISHSDRFQKQIEFILKNRNTDILSTDIQYIEEDKDGKDKKTIHLNLSNFKDWKEIKTQLDRNHNVVAHPTVLYSRKFIENNKYNPEEIPLEDISLWQRTVSEYEFNILPEVLLDYRIHDNQVSKNK